MKAKFKVWFKNYDGNWVEWGVAFATRKAAEPALSYVKKKFALNGQAEIFSI